MDLREYRADLHLHTCLSPCSDTWRMTPREIVHRARVEGLDMIAICDHHSVRNVAAVQRAARRSGVVVLAGMEVTSSEEVHTLGIFGDLERAMVLQDVIDKNLPGENVPDVFGHQVLMDEEDEILGSEHRFLAGATLLSLNQVVEAIHEHGGLAVASHVDRESFSILAQLGWIPEGLPLDALEVSSRCTEKEARDRFPEIKGWPIVRASDAHRPEEVGTAWTRLRMGQPTFDELRLALRCEGGRQVIVGET
jgi:predicted metal-dependent phosphoesterase TrpH